MRVLVTGGAGFFGSHTVHRLVASGHEVVVLDDMWSGSRFNLEGVSVEIIEGSILDPAAVDAGIRGADAVLHMAVRNVRESLKDPKSNNEVNSNGTLMVLERLRLAGQDSWFVYCSSSEVYGNSTDEVLSDISTVCRPATIYGASKYAGELITHAYRETYGVRSCVIRPFNVYGPHANMSPTGSELITRFITQGLSGTPFTVFGDGSQRRDFTWVGDAAQALCSAVETNGRVAGLTINLGSGEAPNVIQVAELVAETLAIGRWTVQRIETRPGDVRSLIPDTSRAQTELDFHVSTSLRDGVALLVNHLRIRFEREGIPFLGERNW